MKKSLVMVIAAFAVAFAVGACSKGKPVGPDCKPGTGTKDVACQVGD
jgi:hypothetical protein